MNFKRRSVFSLIFNLRIVLVVFLSLVVLAAVMVRRPRTVQGASFTPGNLVIYRVGDGSAALSANATAVFLDEYTPAGALVQSIPVPTTTVSGNKRLTASGTATSEGHITRSADGNYLVFAGYDAAVGAASITTSTSATVNRIIGRVDGAGIIDTTTSLTDAISGGNPRGATSTNGTDLWISGTSSGGGIRYATLGATTSTALNTTPVTNLRATNIFGGQLYVSAGVATLRLGSVGTGTPTTGSQTITSIPGFPTAAGGNPTGPYNFYFADLNAGVAGVDTLYVANDDTVANGGGVQKYSLVGGTWTANGTASLLSTRGLTATVSGSTVTLYVTANGSSLQTLTDTSGYNATINGTFSSLATPPTNTAFRGVAFVPTAAATPTPTPAGTPSLSINDVTQAEGNSGTTNFNFTVSLSSAAPAGGVSFTVNTADGTTNPANAPGDYTALTNQPGSISAGNTSTTVTVQVNGDGTTEANETFFVNISNVTNAGVTDAQGLGTITNDDVSVVPIHTIQGSGNSSPFVSQSVTTTGIVTARKTNGYFIQDPNPDADPNTSEALFVFTSSTPTGVAIGDAIHVTGTVAEFISPTSDEPVSASDPKTATELTSPTNLIIDSTGNGLPAAIDAVSNNVFNPAASSRTAALEKYEYMRISVDTLTVYEPTNNNFGEFWGVRTGVARPFREPGIEAGDPIPNADQGTYAGSAPPNIPIFDGNIERIMVDSDESLTSGGARRSALFVTTGAVITNIVGPLDYAFDQYRIDLDATATPGVTPGITAAVAVPTRTAQEFTISHANLENFTSSDATKLNKASLAVRNVLKTPDVLGIIEVDTASSATALANKINADVGNPSLVDYVSYFSETAATQDIGYLVNSARVTVVGSPTQYHVATTFTYCGVTSVLHDRPSFVLNIDVPANGGGTIPVTIILNHTKSLIATDSQLPFGTCGTGTEGARNREKRRLQAEDIADLIQTHISENLVVLGDLNAFDFNDGLSDVVGTLKGAPAPENQVVEASTDRWSYTLTNLVSTLAAAQKYSFAFEGNAQALDHVLVNSAMLSRNTGYVYGRYNGDFDISFATDANRPERVADHDAPVAYFLNSSPTAADASIVGRIVDPNGVPVAGTVINLSGTQNRKAITDVNGYYHFDQVETTGFYYVRPSRANYSFSPEQRSFAQLGNQTEAVFTATPLAASNNPLDTAEYFVRQHYLDFLGREPDESGFNFWSDQINGCDGAAGCRPFKRVHVSAAYFFSIEFQETGGLVDGLYRASFDRAPKYAEFIPDTAALAKDVVVGRTGWQQQLQSNRLAFLQAFVARPAFRAVYDGLANSTFVDQLLTHTRIIYSQEERDALVNGLNNNLFTRAGVLDQLAGDQRFLSAKRNQAFVLMEYFGYLRRDPDPDGYQFWLNKLDQFGGNFEEAEMVKAFIESDEYRQRFPR